MKATKQAKDILADVLEELQGGESNKPIGEGVTSEEYVLTQLMKLWDVLNNREILVEAWASASYSNSEDKNG